MKRALGDTTTSEGELRRAGKALFGEKFNGVFAADERFPEAGFSIVNTKARRTGGEHWLAYANGNMYDSFGRDQSGDAEQHVVQKDCGQRCLAWLCVYDELGADFAANV